MGRSEQHKCSVCGRQRNLIILMGNVYCRKCANALPRRRCASPTKWGRCTRNAIGGALRCPQHEEIKAPIYEWEPCPGGPHDKPIGRTCIWCARRDKYIR